MSETEIKLKRAPIVEAVIDVDCDMPPGFTPAALEEAARDAFSAQYPQLRKQFLEQHRIKTTADEPVTHSSERAMLALQFLHDDQKQLVQVRVGGFSFNRLAPYTTLDDYLPEIERTWRLFVERAMPVAIRAVRLRYINRILLPMAGRPLELNDYIKLGPRLPDEEKLTLVGFLHQYAAVETGTENQANIVLTAQPPEDGKLPLIFDISVASVGTPESMDWDWIETKIQSLRSLKNRIFKNTLTDKCLNLFQR